MTESIKPAYVWLFLGITIVGIGIFIYKSGGSQPEVQIVREAETEKGKTVQVKVDLAGAVVKPGVYDLDKDMRIGEAIVAAGGLADEADKEWVSKNINQAAKITDEMKIYIPKINNQAPMINNQINSNNQNNKQIAINSASQSELESLPGVGPVTAQKIISGRPYSKLEELTERKIVGSSVYSKIQSQITLW